MRVLSGLVALLCGLVLAAAPASAAPAKLSHSAAVKMLKKAGGFTIFSSGGCANRTRPNCTSLTKVNKTTISGVIAFRKASKCAIKITGGTETGHASGKYSHWNGYKVDIDDSTCVTKYIKNKYKRSGTCPGGYPRWKSPAGNVYCHEVGLKHFDITYFKAKA